MVVLLCFRCNMPLFQYNASEGILACTNEPTRYELLRQAFQRFVDRDLIDRMTEESIYCCRMLVAAKPGTDMSDAKMAVAILRRQGDGLMFDLLLWSEAEERGIAKYLLELINEGKGNYQAGIGRLLFPEKTPEGTPE